MRHKPAAPAAILAVVAFGVFVAADDLTVVTTMLRQIVFDLQIPLPDELDKVAWIVNAYLIAYVVIMPIIGRIGDLIGRRAVYLGAMSLFLVGSIWIPVSPAVADWLVLQGWASTGLLGRLAQDNSLAYALFLAGRVLTALGGGAMVPIAMAVLADVYRPERRASALGVLGAVETAGWVWGPLYGAMLVRFLNWRWQFYLNIPLALIGLAGGWWALRQLPPPPVKGRLDWAGALLLTVGLAALNIGLSNSGQIQNVVSLAELSTIDPARTLPYFAVALLALGGLVLVERRRQAQADTAAIFDFRLFWRPNVVPAILVNFLVGSVLIIAMVNVPLIVNVLEIDVARAAVRSGWLLSTMTGAMALLALLGGLATERWSYRPVTMLGLAACGAGFGLLGLTWGPGTPYLPLALILGLLGLGLGLVIAPIGAAIINAAPDDQRGIVASLVIVFRLVGMSVGLSALTAWGQARFNFLRTRVELPPITDPGFGRALADALTRITVGVLAETFLISALIALLAILVAYRLRPDKAAPMATPASLERSTGSP